MPAAVGRPTDFKDEFIEQAEKLCQTFGATDMELADFFEVDVRTIYRWKNAIPKFCQALKVGKAIPDDRVKRSLFQRAVGFEHDSVKVFMPAGADKPVYAPIREYVAPDTTAAIFWLKNRLPDEFRDKSEVEVPGLVSLADTISKARKRAEP